MKKTLIIMAILALPLTGFGAMQAVKVIKSYDFIAQIETFNKGNHFIYKVTDGDNTCYVMVGDDNKYGFEPQMSCVNTPVVPVVKK